MNIPIFPVFSYLISNYLLKHVFAGNCFLLFFLHAVQNGSEVWDFLECFTLERYMGVWVSLKWTWLSLMLHNDPSFILSFHRLYKWGGSTRYWDWVVVKDRVLSRNHENWLSFLPIPKACSGPCQTSKMERLAKIVSDFPALTTFAKRSFLDVWQGFEYAPAYI